MSSRFVVRGLGCSLTIATVLSAASAFAQANPPPAAVPERAAPTTAAQGSAPITNAPPPGTPGATAAPPPNANPTPAGARVLTLDECVAMAITGNVETRASEFDVEVAESSRAGSRGRLLPKLQADGSVQEWDRAFNLPFALPGVSPVPVLTVRDQFTWNAGASIIQPLTGLFGGVASLKADRIGIDLAKLQQESTRRDTGFRAAELYLRLLEAKRLVEVAAASVSALQGQEKQAVSLHTNGVIAKNDLLRAELALSSAKQREIQARGNVVLARGRLATLLGLPRSVAVDAAPLGAVAQAADSGAINVEAAENQSTRRIEVKAFDARIDQADERVTAARDRLLPTINGVANYTHVAGSAFQQKDAAYIGLAGTWDLWDWGDKWSAIDDAKSRREQSKLARVRIEDQVRLEARQAAVDAQVAREALDVARSAVAQGEENYRIVSRRFEEAAGTAFDVVDAESLLTQARAQFENASYGWLVARLALQRATGEATPHVR